MKVGPPPAQGEACVTWWGNITRGLALAAPLQRPHIPAGCRGCPANGLEVNNIWWLGQRHQGCSQPCTWSPDLCAGLIQTSSFPDHTPAYIPSTPPQHSSPRHSLRASSSTLPEHLLCTLEFVRKVSKCIASLRSPSFHSCMPCIARSLLRAPAFPRPNACVAQRRNARQPASSGPKQTAVGITQPDLPTHCLPVCCLSSDLTPRQRWRHSP